VALAFFSVMVGKIFGKPATTRTLAVEEPMVTLDSAAITQRIGRITVPSKPEAPIYKAISSRSQPTEPKWRRALRPRIAA